jgi:hypothetical protein
MGRVGRKCRESEDARRETTYKAGDYLVYNNEDGAGAYAVSAEKFESMYTLADD